VSQGLLALPWYQAARADNKMPPDCSMCRDRVSAPMRQAMGCAFLDPIRDDRGELSVPHAIWKHEGDKSAGQTICPGYTTNLPDVIDIARAHQHWTKGELGTVLGGADGLPPVLADGIGQIDESVQRLDGWRMSASNKKGGAQ